MEKYRFKITQILSFALSQDTLERTASLLKNTDSGVQHTTSIKLPLT